MKYQKPSLFILILIFCISKNCYSVLTLKELCLRKINLEMNHNQIDKEKLPNDVKRLIVESRLIAFKESGKINIRDKYGFRNKIDSMDFSFCQHFLYTIEWRNYYLEFCSYDLIKDKLGTISGSHGYHQQKEYGTYKIGAALHKTFEEIVYKDNSKKTIKHMNIHRSLPCADGSLCQCGTFSMRESVIDLVINLDDKYLAIQTTKELIIFDLIKDRIIKIFDYSQYVSGNKLEFIKFHTTKNILAFAYENQPAIYFWHFDENEEIVEKFELPSPVKCVDFSFDEIFICIATEDGFLRVYDLEKIDSGASYILPAENKIKDIKFSYDNEHIAIVENESKILKLWDFRENVLYEIEYETNIVSIAFSKDSKLACSLDNGEIIIHDFSEF